MGRFLRFLKKHRVRVVILTLLVGWFGFRTITSMLNGPEPTQFSAIEQSIVNNEVESAVLYDEESKIVVTTTNGAELEGQYIKEGGDELQALLTEKEVTYEVSTHKPGLGSYLARNWWWMVLIALYIGLYTLGPKLMAATAQKQIGTTDYLTQRPKERFTDVKGADEAIAELQLVKDSLRHPEKYKGFRIDRGILLHGPTGTGKTLLAKALAGEAGVPYFRLSGAGLSSMWAGGTSQRIESFFGKVKQHLTDPNAPAVVFIDEIDGIATRRVGNQNADRDRNTAVTQLLDQIGKLFDFHPNVVVIGATNLLHSLDEAIKRPGRLGKHIAMPNPDIVAREHILDLNDDDMDLDNVKWSGIAELTEGLSGAAVAQIPHEATQVALRKHGERKEGESVPITQHHIERATMQVVMGTLRESAAMDPKDHRIVVVHESGHATLAQASPFHRLLIMTSIPIEESGGSTWCPPVDSKLLTEESVRWRLAVSMAGREAEKLDCKVPSVGGGHDIESATNLILLAICRGGLFVDIPMDIDPNNWEKHPRAEYICGKIEELLEEACWKAHEVLVEHETFRKTLQARLLDKRILYSDELEALAADF